MWRRLGAAVAVLAFLSGMSAAPYTHAHHAIDSVADEHHPQGQTLVHTHASAHAHDAGHSDPAPADHDESDERIWSVHTFVLQAPAPDPAPMPTLALSGEPHAQLTGSRLGAHLLRPTAHGPPCGSSSGLRAPPAFLPATL